MANILPNIIQKEKDVARTMLPNPRAVAVISLLILVSLGIQGGISLVLPLFYSKTFHATWPFINYPMYRPIHHQGDIISNHLIIGVHEDGSESVIKPADFDWDSWFYDVFVNVIIHKDRTAAEGFLQMDPHTRNVRWKSLRVVDRGKIFRWAGLTPAPETQIAVLNLEPSQKGQP